jgi:hypothetical protein
VQELSSLTGLALHRTIRKIPNGAGKLQSLGFPPSLRGRTTKIGFFTPQLGDGMYIRHFHQIQLNCEINSTPGQGYNFRQTKLGFN